MPWRYPKSVACFGGPFDRCDVELARADSSVFYSLDLRVFFSPFLLK
jgi:hypothetical protein